MSPTTTSLARERDDRLITLPFAVVTASVFAFFVYVGILVPILPTYVEDELRGGELGVGLAIAAFAGAAIAIRPVLGWAIIRFGRRAVMITGALVAACSGALYGLVDQLPALLALRALTGVGEAALFVAAATLVSDLAPAHRQAEASSYFSVAVYGGLGIGPLFGDSLQSAAGYRMAFLVAAVSAVIAAAVAVAAPKHRPTVAAETSSAAVDATPIDLARSTRWVHPAALGPGIVLAIGMAAFATFSAFMPEHARSLGLSGSGALFATYSVVCLALRVFGARLPERLGARTSVTIAFVVLGSGLALLAVVAEVWALWVASALIGAGAAFLYPSLIALTINQSPDDERPKAISSFTMFFEIGTAAGGLALGALADSLGKRTGFAVAAGLAAVGVWVLRTIVLPRPATVAEPAAVVAPALAPVCGD